MRWMFVLALAPTIPGGCAQTIRLDDDEEDEPEATITEACELATPETTTLVVSFPEREPGCDWGEDGNLEPAQGALTARAEDVQGLDLPADVAICDVGFDFQGVDPEVEQHIRYDDHFLLTFDDVVLASSYEPMVERLAEDGHLRSYDWEALAGYEFEIQDFDTYCLGGDEGLSACTVPPAETEGVITLDFGKRIVNELAEVAHAQGRYDFGFVTVGDNDPDVDCSHTEFSFTVDVDYVAY